MKTILIGVILAGPLAVSGCSQTSEKAGATGPNGGDLVAIKGGAANAELLANADTGEVLVHTWDKDLKTRRPIEEQPITVGSGDNSVELTPHPMDTDPSGTCSRFYGQASWVRGGGVHNVYARWRHRWPLHVRLEPLLAGGPVARPHVGGDGQPQYGTGAHAW